MDDEKQAIVELQMRLAYQEQAFDDLSQTVNDQWKIIDRLDKKLDALTRRLLELEEQGVSEIAVTKPPHW